MIGKRDYYEILGVERTADEKSLKRAYRKLVKKYHPDTNPGEPGAERKFKEITEAYNVLSDPEKRKFYDRFGEEAFEESTPGTGAYGGFGGQNGRYQEYHFESDSMDDILKGMFGNFFHKGNFRGNSFRQNREFGRRGRDLKAEVTVSLEEAAFGCEKIVNLRCSDGAAQSLQVHIPAGIENGQSIRLRQKGEAGLNGGQPGDLLMKVTVGEKRGFRREGTDLYTTVEIPFTTAVFGGEAIVRTLDGQVRCQIQAGTQSGTKLRLRGKGIVSRKNPSIRGDLYAAVQIQVPTVLSPEERRKLKEYENVCARGKKRREGAA